MGSNYPVPIQDQPTRMIEVKDENNPLTFALAAINNQDNKIANNKIVEAGLVQIQDVLSDRLRGWYPGQKAKLALHILRNFQPIQARLQLTQPQTVQLVLAIEPYLSA